MLTIGKLGSTKGQLQYYEQQVASGIEDYYAGRGEARGVWRGSGAEALGLRAGRELDDGEFMALMRGLNPVDGSVLRLARGKHVSVWNWSALPSATGAILVAQRRGRICPTPAARWSCPTALP